MKKLASKLISIDLVRHNLIFLAGTLVISFFNYLYYPVLSRLVSVVDFGEIQAVISIFMQLGILLTAFGYVVTNITNNSNPSESRQSILFLERVTIVCSLALLVIIIIFGKQLSASFQFSSILPLIMVGFLVVLNVPSTSRSYILQGLRRLKQVSISGVIFSAGKLIATVILVHLGLGVEAAITGYILAQLATLIYLELRSRDVFPRVRESFNRPLKGRDGMLMRRELVFGVFALVLLTGAAFLYSFDVVVARLFFTPEIAGEYSGVSSVARIIYFATASVAGVLIASVGLSDDYKRSRRVLMGSASIVTGVGMLILMVFCIFPGQSITILLGTAYAHLAYLLPETALFMFFASVNNLLISFQIARRRKHALWSTAAGIMVLVICLLYSHEVIGDLIRAYLVSNVVVFAILAIQIARKDNNE